MAGTPLKFLIHQHLHLHLLLLLLAILTFISFSSAQWQYFQQPDYSLDSIALHSSSSSSPSIFAAQPDYGVAHPAVVANAQRESELPSELRKSDRFYKNPHIAAALAKESWFTDKEMPVINREAEKIPREMIFKIFHDAGWIKRR